MEALRSFRAAPISAYQLRLAVQFCVPPLGSQLHQFVFHLSAFVSLFRKTGPPYAPFHPWRAVMCEHYCRSRYGSSSSNRPSFLPITRSGGYPGAALPAAPCPMGTMPTASPHKPSSSSSSITVLILILKPH